MSKQTATLVREKLPKFSGHANLYRLSEPLDGNEYVIVSAVNMGSRFPMDHVPLSMQIETYIFPASEDGEVIDWGELFGSMKGTLSHIEALGEAGYEVES